MRLVITPELLTSQAQKLMNCKTEQQNALNTIKGLIDGIVSGWEGEAQQAFYNSFNAKKAVIEEFIADMERFSRFMKQHAQHIAEIDRGFANKLNGTVHPCGPLL